MIDNSGYVASVIVVLAAITFALRALPFIAAKWLEKHQSVQNIGRFLPLVIMLLLLLHTATGLALQSNYHAALWQVFSLALAMVLQYRFGAVLLSVGASSLLYIAVRNFV